MAGKTRHVKKRSMRKSQKHRARKQRGGGKCYLTVEDARGNELVSKQEFDNRNTAIEYVKKQYGIGNYEIDKEYDVNGNKTLEVRLEY